MATSYTVHGTPQQVSSNNPNVATFPWMGTNSGQRSLALGADSATIIGPCELRLYADEAQFIDIQAVADAASLNPGASPFKVGIGVEWFSLGRGSWVFRAIAA